MPFLLLTLLLSSFGYAGASMGPGVTGGGADLKPEAKPDLQSVVVMVEQTKKILPFVLYFLEEEYRGYLVNKSANGDWSTPRYQIEAALFSGDGGRKNVYEKLKNLNFVVKLKGPCVDGEKNPKAGSAYPFESADICFSAELIREGTIGATLERRLLALALHEVIHKMGIYDEGAVAKFEQETSENLPLSPYSFMEQGFSRLWQRVEPEVDSGLPLAVERLENSLRTNATWSSLCVDIARVSLRAEGLWGLTEFPEVPLTSLRPRNRFFLKVLEAKTRYLSLYCQRDNELERLAEIDFGNGTEMKEAWLNPLTGENISVSVRRPILENRSLLTTEIRELIPFLDPVWKESRENGDIFYDSVPQ